MNLSTAFPNYIDIAATQLYVTVYEIYKKKNVNQQTAIHVNFNFMTIREMWDKRTL